MSNKYKENVEILRQYLNKELPVEEINREELSLQELQDLQYRQHLKQLEPIIYRKQE
jgi:hypothetical protein